MHTDPILCSNLILTPLILSIAVTCSIKSCFVASSCCQSSLPNCKAPSTQSLLILIHVHKLIFVQEPRSKTNQWMSSGLFCLLWNHNLDSGGKTTSHRQLWLIIINTNFYKMAIRTFFISKIWKFITVLNHQFRGRERLKNSHFFMLSEISWRPDRNKKISVSQNVKL